MNLSRRIRSNPVTTNAATMNALKSMAAAGNPDGVVLSIERAANRIAIEMAEIHGGEWTVNINHDACLVAVSRVFP